MEIYLAHTQGFCAGVAYAIAIVEAALKKYGTPLYVRHHIVHNTAVIKDFEKRGVIFVEELKDIPPHKTVIFSAHGVAPQVYEEAKQLELNYIDATCPLVTKVHKKAAELSAQNIPVILIGHKGHQEIIGTSGHIKPDLLHIIQTAAEIKNLKLDPQKPLGYLTQTTLSLNETKEIIEELKKNFPHLLEPAQNDICYATQNRQNAVIELAQNCDLVIICGSPNSSNSKRLSEISHSFGVKTLMIDDPINFDPKKIKNYQKIGISSGASVPSYIVEELVKKINSLYPQAQLIKKPSIEKNIKFPLPKNL
jgi:4-hydroxy-3-methylbut-2-enyl diphosphate reductase